MIPGIYDLKETKMSNSITVSSLQNNSVDQAELASIKSEEIQGTWKANEDKKSRKMVVVYNKGSMQAVLSAALIKQRYPLAQVVEASLQIPENGEQYIWIGGIPNLDMFSGKNVWSAEHIVVTEGYGFRQFSLRISKLVSKELFTPYGVNSVSQLMQYLNINLERYMGLVEVVHRFYDKNLDLSTLAFIYENVKNAEKSLTTEEFIIEAPCAEQLDAYMQAVKLAKAEINGNYLLKKAAIKNKIKTIFITCNIKDLWLVRRLSGFVYDTYVNTSMMLRGPSVQSNIAVSEIIDFSKVTSVT